MILPDGPAEPSVIKKVLIQKQTDSSVRKLVEEQMNLGISVVNLDKVAIAISLRNWEQKLKGLGCSSVSRTQLCQIPKYRVSKT